MASVTLVIKRNKVNARGEMPIYLRIIEYRKAKFISLPIKLHPSLWDDTKKKVKKGYPNSARVNLFLAKKIAEAHSAALDLKTDTKFATSKKIKEQIIGHKPQSFLKYADQYLRELHATGQVGTYRRIKAVISKLKHFIQTDDFDFNDFDLDFLKKYDEYLRQVLKNSQNTIHANLKVFRRMFNAAAREEVIEATLNPFTKFQMRTEKTAKSFLSDEELLAIENLQIPEDTVMFHHRNLFVFACYAGGLRISDVLQLKWKHYDETHIRFKMQKTNELMQIKLPSKAIEILDFYEKLIHTKNDYVFPFLKKSIDYSRVETLHNAISSNTAYANKNLKIIASKAGLEKNISFHTSRHSFATRALKKGMRIEYVSKILGHQKIQTTQIYAKIVNSELDKAMDVFDE